MKYISLSFLLFLMLSPSSMKSQAVVEQAFMYIGQTPVYPEAFLRMYKKNLQQQTPAKLEDLDAFLSLFVRYKQILAEARSLKLDTTEAYLKEVAAYNKEIAKQFFEESSFTNVLLEEIYERNLTELHASHILIKLSPHIFGKDTLKAYNKIKALKERAEAGEDFNQLAMSYSQEALAADTKGDIGYFSAMQMLIPFEDVAYKTPIGEISEIVRTGYGYHIIKIHDKRLAENKLRVAHILILHSEDPIADTQLVQEAYMALEAQRDFVEVALKYSQDIATQDNRASLDVFGRRDVPNTAFVDMAYSLEEGEYSIPFKTHLGWHIVLLKEKVAPASKEIQLEAIKQFVASSGVRLLFDKKRSLALLDLLEYELLAKKYKEDLLPHIDRDFLLRTTEKKSFAKVEDQGLFKLKGHLYTYRDFLIYLETHKQYATEGMSTEQVLHNALDAFSSEEAIAIYMQEVNKENKEYLIKLEEVSEGILLFDLMQQEVWGKAGKDSLAHQRYYKSHQAAFDLPERLEVEVYQVKEELVAKQIQNILKSGKQKEEIGKEFAIQPSFKIWTQASEEYAFSALNLEQLPTIIKTGGFYKVVQKGRFLPAIKRDFTAAKDDVIQAWVLAYEKEWKKALENKHKFKLKKKEWEKIKSKCL